MVLIVSIFVTSYIASYNFPKEHSVIIGIPFFIYVRCKIFFVYVMLEYYFAFKMETAFLYYRHVDY